MCLFGIYKMVNIINPNQNEKCVTVDACIADEIQELNNQGIITLGACCGHGRAGEIIEWTNDFGIWKSYQSPPNVLIHANSVEKAKLLGYRPFPYYYADGKKYDVWQMYLNTGCLTKKDCMEWHKINAIPYKENLGII